MKKIIRLTESELIRLVRRVIKENEEEWISQSQDIEGESDFSKMEKLKQNEDFQELVAFFEENPEAAEEIKNALEMSVNESYKYYDYGDTRGKKEITRNHFLKRKLITYGIASLVSGIIGYMMGTMAGDEILQAALISAGMGGAVWGTLASEVGREKVKDEDEQINEMEDEDFMRGADRNWEDMLDDEEEEHDDEDDGFDYDDDEEWGETDMGEESLQDLIEDARDILENELGFSIDAINELDEFDIVDALRDHGYDDEAYDIEYLMEKEGFYNVDEDEPYDSIGGHSVNDIKRAFENIKKSGKGEVEEELDETWDDFTQKRRFPKGYKPERYQRIPKDYFRTPRRLDPEGTIGMPKKEDPFDEYEDFDDEEFA